MPYPENQLELVMPYFPIYADPDSSDLASQDDPDVLDPSVSAILGGSRAVLLPGEAWPRCGSCEDTILVPYLQINVSSPHTPVAFREKVEPAVAASPGHETVLLQVFVCAEDEGAQCFGERLVGAYDDSFLVRVVRVGPDTVMADASGMEGGGDSGGKRFFVKRRVVGGWTVGNPEMLHEAVNLAIAYDDPQYLDHEPASGLKLLGFPVQGKYYTSIIDPCPKTVLPREGSKEMPEHDTRCLLQLGTHSDDEDAPICTVGNTWIEQCTVHPEVLSMTIGGDW